MINLDPSCSAIVSRHCVNISMQFDTELIGSFVEPKLSRCEVEKYRMIIYQMKGKIRAQREFYLYPIDEKHSL